MLELNTIYDDIGHEITNRLQGADIGKIALNAQCRAVAKFHIEKHPEIYQSGSVEENERQIGLCLIVHIVNSLINFDKKYNALIKIYDYLDPDLTEKIDKDKAIEVIHRVMK
jgi:hypothetical protein